MPDPFPALWAEHAPALVAVVHRDFPEAPCGDVEAVCRDLYRKGYTRQADMAEALLWLASATTGQVPTVTPS